jgi:hypothetical protein
LRPKKRAIAAAIHEVLTAEGFTRTGTTWHYDGEETILVVNLQGSMWGNVSYINLAVWVKALGRAKVTKEHVCHIRTRLRGVKLEKALDEEDRSLSDDERLRTITLAVRTRGLAFLNSCATIARIKRLPKKKLDEVAILRVRKLIRK